VALLAAAGLFLPAAVMGPGAGLELLHPFAVALLVGLVSAVAVVLLVVPTAYPALAGLRPPPPPPDAVVEPADPEAASPDEVPGPRAERASLEKETEAQR
jgi:hypothetical protein